MSRYEADRKFKTLAMEKLNDILRSAREGIKEEFDTKLSIKLEKVDEVDVKNLAKENLVGKAEFDDMAELEKSKKVADDIINGLNQIDITKMVKKHGTL